MVKKLISALLFLLMTRELIGQTYTLDLRPLSGSGKEANVQRDNPDANLGQEDVLRFSSSAGIVERALLKFDLNNIPPGVDILSANLILNGVRHTVNVPGDGVLQMVAYPWDENTVNWNISSIFEDSEMPSVHIGPPSGGGGADSYTLDVAGMVQKMVNTPLVNFGWMLKIEDETGGTDESYSFGTSSNPDTTLAPELIITYCNHLSIKAFASAATSTTNTDAGVYLDVSGGVPPFTYAWSNSATTKDIYNIAPGLYTVTVTDDRGFSSAKIILIPGSCGTLTLSVLNAPGSYGNARTLNESFNDNTANSNDLSVTDLEAHNLPDDDGQSVARSLFAFDLSSLPDNVVVNSATLRLTDDESPQASSFTVQLCRVNDTWNERTATFNNEPAYNNSTEDVVEFAYDATNTYYDIDVSAQLQSMISQGTTTQGWIIKLKDETPDAAGNSAKFADPKLNVVLAMSTFACDDAQLNWDQTDVYNDSGVVISSEKNYYDNLGRSTQKLVKNAFGEVFRTQTVYDSYGFAAVNSMPAYSGTQLKYQTNFMLNQTGQVYSYTDFDTPATLNNNTGIQYGVTNSLGYYYSDLNTYDAYQATSGNPYSRIENTALSVKTRVSKPGNAYKMGSGHESTTFNIMSGDELKYIFGTTGSDFYSYKAVRSGTANVLECSPITVDEPIRATKQIMITPDNPEVITYSIGDKVIATCYSGLSLGETYTNMTTVTNTMMYYGTRCVDIHLPDVDKSSLSLPIPVSIQAYTSSVPGFTNIPYTITDLYTDRLLVAGSEYTIGGSTRSVTFSPAFLSLYTNKSLFIRISFNYSSAYTSSLIAHSIFPLPDAVVSYHLSYGRASKNYYDLGSALRKSVSPKGFNIATPSTNSMTTTYDYSHRGEVIGVKSPDQGVVEMVYNTEGKLRFSQNEVQKASNYFSYINYDKHGRAYETGENHSSAAVNSVSFFNYYMQGTGGYFSWLILDNQDGLYPLDKAEVTSTSYTVPSGTDVIPAGYSYKSQYNNFRNGQVNFIRNANSTVWYNYDKLDRKLATITQVTETDFVAKHSGIDNQVKTSESAYDYFTGLTTSSTYQTNNSNESLYYQFNYNANQQPTLTTLAYGGTTHTLNTSSYNKMGQLKRTVIGKNYQGVDYVYMLNGGLKAINHPGLDATLDPGGDAQDYSGGNSGVNKDLFGEIVEYHNKDYERTGINIVSMSSGTSKYDGLIYGSRFKTQNVVNTTTTGANFVNYMGPGTGTAIISLSNYKQQELRFEYSYDEFNQLAGSIFETFNNFVNVVTNQYSDYQESGPSGGDITYDRNGNITRLVRAAYGGTTLDNLTYTVVATNNKLTDILDAASNSFPQSINFKTASTTSSSSFGYNAIGQMTASTSENISSITYFPNGKIKKIIFTNSDTSEYKYGAMGEKLKSKYYNYSTAKHKYTWYAGPYIYELDEAGTNTFVIKEAQVPGGVIRVSNSATVSSGYLVYNISDHLGNVRVSFTAKTSGNTTGTGIEILSYNDYYAYGGQLPGRSYSSENYRYGFQGQEKSEDGTNWDQFELRNYNHDLGRWFAPDPYGQFASPYIAMANNPVSTTDPDGGFTMAGDNYGGQGHGQWQDKWDRAHHSGAYSAENTQKRYDMYYQDILDKFLLYKDGVLGSQRDVATFLDAMKDLNNYFGGLKDNYPIGFQTGIDYLSNSEIALNLDAVKEVALTIPYNPKDMLRSMETDLSANSQDACSLKSNSADRDGFAFMDAANQLNGDPEEQNSYQNNETDNNSNNSEATHASFDGEGEKETADNTIAELQKQAGEKTSDSKENVQTGGGATIEELLRGAMNMKPGTEISGDQLAETNTKLEKAGGIIDNITILEGDKIQINLTFSGKMAIHLTQFSNIDGAEFTLSNYKNKYYPDIEGVRIQSSTAKFGKDPLNLIINDNTYSLSTGLQYYPLFKK